MSATDRAPLQAVQRILNKSATIRQSATNKSTTIQQIERMESEVKIADRFGGKCSKMTKICFCGNTRRAVSDVCLGGGIENCLFPLHWPVAYTTQ